MAPGLPEPEIRERLTEAGFTATQEIIDWFNWCNGVTPARGRGWPIAPGGLIPVSLEESICELIPEGRYDAGEAAKWGAHTEEQENPEYWWPRTWLPIGFFDATKFVADTSSPDGVHCPLAEVTYSEKVPMASSISIAVQYWIDALNAGCVKWVDGIAHQEPRWGPPWPPRPEPGMIPC